MLIYSQTKGTLSTSGKGTSLAGVLLLGTGYSGKGDGRNNPAAQMQIGIGPIPRGFYRLGHAYHSARTGPVTIPLYALDLDPYDDIVDHAKRSAFRIHGDNATGTASSGCIIMNRPVREKIEAGRDEILWVII